MQPSNSLKRAQPLYFIGDSHAMLFRHLLFEAGGGRHFLCLGKHLALTCLNILGASGEFHPRLLGGLLAENLVKRGASGLAPAQPQAPVLVLCIGEIELRAMFDVFGPEADFVDPQAPADPPDPQKRLIPFDLIRDELAQLANRLGRAFETLQAHGFARLYLHAIPPQQPPPDLAPGTPWQPSPLRRRLAALFHRLLRAECRRTGTGFIDISERVMHEGRLLPEYFLDGIHLHPRALQFSVEYLLAKEMGLHEVRLAGRARPIYVLGDASVECFRGVVYTRSAGEVGYACKAHMMEDFSFASALDSDGKMNRDFVQILDSESMLARDPRSGEQFPVGSALGDAVFFQTVGSADDPAIAVACGEADVARLQSCDARPATHSDAALADLVDPLLAGLMYYQRLGFKRIAVLGVATRGVDAMESALRARLNAALETRVHAAGLRYIAPPASYEASSVPHVLEALIA